MGSNLSVTFVIEYEEKYLLVSRGPKEGNYPGKWAFPGGKVNINETALSALVREVKEETGLNLEDRASFLDCYIFETSNGKIRQGVAFLVKSTDDKTVFSDEISDYRWINSLEDLYEMKDKEGKKFIPGIFNHLERAMEVTEKRCYSSLKKMNLLYEDYLNK